MRRSSMVMSLLGGVAEILAKERVLSNIQEAMDSLDQIGMVGAQILSERLLSILRQRRDDEARHWPGDRSAEAIEDVAAEALSLVEAATLRRIAGREPSWSIPEVPEGLGITFCEHDRKRQEEASMLLDRMWCRWTSTSRDEGDSHRNGNGIGADGADDTDEDVRRRLRELFAFGDDGPSPQQDRPGACSSSAAADEPCDCASSNGVFEKCEAWWQSLDAEKCAALLARWNEAAAFADCSILITLRQRRSTDLRGRSRQERLDQELHGSSAEPALVRAQTEKKAGLVRVTQSVRESHGKVFGTASCDEWRDTLDEYDYRVTVVDIAAKLSSRFLERPRMGLQQLTDALRELDFATRENHA
eukprot:scaffold8075_cov410-Pinguiococcus_pyrenoidosus.AAC.1